MENEEPKYDFNRIKEELRIIRKRRFELKQLYKDFKFFNAPVLFLRYFVKYGDISKIKNLKRDICEDIINLKEKYSYLREIYSHRFDSFKDEELFHEYEKKLPRYFSLEEKIENLNLMNEGISNFQFGKKKKIKRVLKDVQEEFNRRDRDLNELIYKIEEERKLSIEIRYTHRIKIPVKKDKKSDKKNL